MIYMAMIVTTLWLPAGPVEVELLVPSDKPLAECAGEVRMSTRTISLTCRTWAGEMVDYEITGAYDV